MEYKINIRDKDTICYDGPCDKIIINSKDEKYDIDVKDLFDYLKSKNKTSKSSVKIVDHIIQNIYEPDDEFMKLGDDELIKVAYMIIKEAKEKNIVEYYKQNIPKFRPFNLNGLVSNNKIQCESKRRTIRDLCRKCKDFLLLKDSIDEIDKLETKKTSVVNDPIETNRVNDPIEISEPIIIEHSKTCIHEFKRGTLKGQICGNPSILDRSYCKICISKHKIYPKISIIK